MPWWLRGQKADDVTRADSCEGRGNEAPFTVLSCKRSVYQATHAALSGAVVDWSDPSGYPDSSMIDIDSLPADPLEALRELSRVDSELEELRRDRVEAARREGATWEQIGESLGMSRQSAWEYYTSDARRVLTQTAAGNEDLDEGEAIRIATEEVDQVRRRRRTGS